MTKRIRLVRAPATRQFLEPSLTLTPENRTLMNGLVDALDLFGDGDPEGVQPSKSPRIYFDDVNRFIYAKFLDAIEGDNKRGWFLISTEAGGITNKSVSESNYQVVIGNKNIKLDPGVSTVTAIDAAEAEGQEITFNNQSGGGVDFLADAAIEGTFTIPNLATSSWFFVDGGWWLK